MRTVDWQDLRFAVGELTRKQQFELWRGISELDDALPAVEYNAAVDCMLAAFAVRSIAKRSGSSYDAVDKHDSADYALSMPLTLAQLQDAPASLVGAICKAAAEENVYIIGMLYAKNMTVLSSMTPNELASDSALS